MNRSENQIILPNLNKKRKIMFDKYPEDRYDQDLDLYNLEYSSNELRLRESLETLLCVIKSVFDQWPDLEVLPIISKVVDDFRQEAKDINFGSTRDPFSCPYCYGVLFEPTTLPCGHTYCKPCVLKDLRVCLVCQAKIPSQEKGHTFHTNILVSSIVQKWWPKEYEGAAIRNKANKLFAERDYAKALELYTEAISIAPHDHVSLSNRSKTFYALGWKEDALRDANEVILRCPNWAKGHHRKGKLLNLMDRKEDALVSLFVCASLECSQDLSKMLREITMSVMIAMGQRALRLREDYIVKTPCGGYKFSDDPRRSSVKENFELKRLSSKRKRRLSDAGLGGPEDLTCEGPFTRLLQKFVTEMEHIRSRSGVRARSVNHCDISQSDFECSLCYHSLWQAVTTPCGHTFCRACLDRSLDHAIHCPLCKTSLREYLAENRSITTEFVEEALRQYLPAEYDERGRQHEQELAEFAKAGKDPQHEIPIFVATLAIPSVACPLHVFEPRYRLMVRRVMEAGTNEFGMCMPSDTDENGYSNYGTMLEVREVRPLSDGRRIVNAVGSRRFRCVSKGVKDGYNTASVEYLRDHEVTDGVGLEELHQLHDSVHLRARSWFESINTATKRRILSHYGPMPAVESEYWTLPDGPVWIWWLIAILPLEPSIQMRLMRECNLQARLFLISQILRCVLLHQSGLRGAPSTKSANTGDKTNPQ